MKIRRYIGSSTHEAILKVKMDLGSDALILNTKKVRQKGLFKMFSKPMVEVLAAIDENKSDSQAKASNRSGNKSLRVSDSVYEVRPNDKNEISEDKIMDLEKKVNLLEGILGKINEKLDIASNYIKNSNGKVPEEETGYLEIFYNNLVKNDVEPEIAEFIIDKVKEKISNDSCISEIANALVNTINSILGKPEPIKLRTDGKPTVAIFVGPTGVGKTTTIAKIAASFALNQKKNVGLLTSDTYRISAVDQLKTYAEIMGLPLSVLYSVEDAEQAVENFADKDLILIDTPGRSHKDKKYFQELRSLIKLTGADDIYLVLSTTISVKNVNETIKNYAFLDNFKIILTKLDESLTHGIILNTRYRTGRNLSYITTGQSVPDDIELADINKIPKNLMGSIN